MSSFCGSQDKCRACDKTVHFIDLLTADGVIYHKTCFKCSQCKGTLSISHYSSLDGVLYCKPHYEQLFKETGSYSKIAGAGGKPAPDKEAKAPSKAASMFSGTQDKCGRCQKTAYPLEKVTVEGAIYHKNCFRCYHSGCKLTTSNYAALDGVLYCKHHFSQLFKEKGSYSQLNQVATSRHQNPSSQTPTSATPMSPLAADGNEATTAEADNAQDNSETS